MQSKSNRRTQNSSLRFALMAVLFLSVLYILAGSYSVFAQEDGDGGSIYLPVLFRDHIPSWVWLPVETVTLTPSPWPGNEDWLALDAAGQVHFLWDTLNTPSFIYHIHQAPGGWSEPAPIDATLGTSYLLYAPVIDPAGGMHVVWRNWLGSGQDNAWRLMYAGFDGVQWQANEVYRTNNSIVEAMTHLDESGNVRVTYIDSYISSAPAYQVARTANGWTPAVKVDPGHASSATWPDRKGGVHFYGDQYPDELRYSYWKDGVFWINNQLLAGKVSSKNSQLDGANNLHLFWTGQVPVPGGTVNGLYRQCLNSDSMLMSAVEVLSSDYAVSGTPLAASDGGSQVVIGWKQTGEDRLWLSIWDGCQRYWMTSTETGLTGEWELRAVAIGGLPRKVCAMVRKPFADAYSLVCATY